MKLDWLKIVKSGLKVIAAVLGGVAVYCGIEKITKTKEKVEENVSQSNGTGPMPFKSFADLSAGTSTDPKKDGIVKKSEKFISVMKVAQAICSSASEVSKGVVSVASNFARVFDPESYKESLPKMSFQGSNNYPSGDYTWDPRSGAQYGDVSFIPGDGNSINEFWGK